MTTSEMVNYFNHLLKVDKKSVSHFFLDRIDVEDKVAESELVIVTDSQKNQKYKLGMLGILNGMLSFYAEKKIVMVQDSETGEILEFANQSSIR